MNFLVTEDEVCLVNTDNIGLKKEIPLGFWKLDAAQYKGIFLSKTNFKLSHGKIYGNSQNIADHIVTAYEKSSKEKNLGVLFSGGRGLGKTLTARLVIEKLSKEKPIIIVSDYIPGMAEFLSNIKDCVIIMDEFEKFMSGNIRGNEASDEQTKQESLLSLLDGNTGSSGNLFLFTVNDTYKIDENLKSRPGRIKYHYKFKSESAEVVRAYCEDNLNDKSLIEEVVLALSSAEYVSMDIITSFIEELNNFPGSKPLDVVEYFNIESGSKTYRFTIVVRDEEDGAIYHFERICTYINYDTMSLIKTDMKKYKDLQNAEGNKTDYYFSAVASIDKSDLPTYVFGKTEIPLECVEVDLYRTFDGENYNSGDTEMKVVAAYIEDPNSSLTMKKYMGSKDFADL